MTMFLPIIKFIGNKTIIGKHMYIVLALSYSETFYYDKVRLNLSRLNLKYSKLQHIN